MHTNNFKIFSKCSIPFKGANMTAVLGADKHIALYNEASRAIREYILESANTGTVDLIIAVCYKLQPCQNYVAAFNTPLQKKEATRYIRALITRWIRDYVESTELPEASDGL